MTSTATEVSSRESNTNAERLNCKTVKRNVRQLCSPEINIVIDVDSDLDFGPDPAPDDEPEHSDCFVPIRQTKIKVPTYIG